ncbi:MAG: hypothetical protein K1X55_04610 [Chitinophagales bacterium]|nr:hypothetical protein [Chitinophagales bacterium]
MAKERHKNNLKQIPTKRKYPINAQDKSVISFPIEFEFKILRGFDDRKDFYDVNSEYAPNFKTCCALIPSSELIEFDEHHYKIYAPYTFGENFSTPEFMFRNQHIISLAGTAVAIGQNEILTAYHVVKNAILDKNRNPTDFSLVFDYQMNAPDQKEYLVEKTAVFQLSRIITPKEIDANAEITNFGENDFVFLVVTENIPDERIAKINNLSATELPPYYAIGYPHKLPAKMTGISPTFATDNVHLGQIKLDLFQFNSGSPLFNRDTHHLEGILISAYKPSLDQDRRLQKTDDADDNKDTFIKIGYIEPYLKTILNLKKNENMSKKNENRTKIEPIYSQLSVTRFEIIRQIDLAKDDEPTAMIRLYDFETDDDAFDTEVLLDGKGFSNLSNFSLNAKGRCIEVMLSDKMLNPLNERNFNITIKITRKSKPDDGTFELSIIREIPEKDGSQPIGGTQGDIMVVNKP